MGGDPCPGKYKFAAIAIKCNSVSSAKYVQTNMIMNDEYFGFTDYDYNDNNYSKIISYLYMVIILLLVINLICFTIYFCRKRRNNNNNTSRKGHKYKVVHMDSESDLDNLKQ